MRTPALVSVALGLAGLAPCLDAQSCKLACDINQVANTLSSSPEGARTGPGSTWPSGFVKCGKWWFFTATTTAAGRELWKTDGTPKGTVMVKDILPDAQSSSPRDLTCCKGRVFFSADNGRYGRELWVSDGTAAGTRMVKDIRPGRSSSDPSHLECLGNKVVFAANNRANGSELWISDGTAAGTRMVKDILPGSISSSPSYLKADSAGNSVYFRASNGAKGAELWKTDGTPAGTVLLKDIYPGSKSSWPSYFINVGNKTVFQAANATNGRELWITDGTPAGTKMLKDIRPGSSGSFPNLYYGSTARIGNKLYFAADDGTHGTELWETDGTAAGTRLAADIRPGPSSGSPFYMVAAGTTLFFRATGATSGTELFKFSGGKVTLVKDIRPGGSGSSPMDLAAFGANRVLFSADDGTSGREPWVSNGTPAGTTRLGDLWSGSSNSSPRWFTVLAPNVALFAATNSTNGRELFRTAGTPASTTLFKDLLPGHSTASSSPSNLACAWGSTLYLSADDGKHGAEPWIQDVATGKCSILKDIRVGRGGSSPSQFTPCWTGATALVFFTADDGAKGAELWVSDGTPAGTKMLKDIRPGSQSSSPWDFVRCRGKVFFRADNGTHGAELWVSNGTPAGTKMLKDIRSGSLGSYPGGFVCCGGRLYFSAYTGTQGRELWVSDGTPAGTKLLKDILPGSRSSYPSRLVCCNGKVYFRATDATHGYELWVSDGTSAGTKMVKDIYPGLRQSSYPDNLVCCNGKVFFSATGGAKGTELWVSDGTPAGTKMVKDIRPGSGSSSPQVLTCVGHRVYFSAHVSSSVGSHGRELWVSDGTSAGTKEVCDLYRGNNSSSPAYLTVCGGKLFFSAYEPVKGRELYVVERPGAAVEWLGEGCPPSYPTLDSTPPRLGGSAVVTSRRGPAGHVGFLVLGVPVSRPVRMPFSAPCALWLDHANGPILPIGASSNPPAFTRTLAIPNVPRLEGGKVMLQTLWLNSQTLFPIKGSNGARLTIGK